MPQRLLAQSVDLGTLQEWFGSDGLMGGFDLFNLHLYVTGDAYVYRLKQPYDR